MNRDFSDRLAELETDCGLEDLAETVREPTRRITARQAALYGGVQSKASTRRGVITNAANRSKRKRS